MRSATLAALLVFFAHAAPAQDSPSSPGTSETDAIAPFDDVEVGGAADGAYLPLALGRDRTGIGLRARLSFGWDSNVHKVDRHDDSAAFGDAIAQAHFGLDLGKIAAGVRGLAAGRAYFDQPDGDLWDLRLGGFLKIPYGEGGLGMGLSADVLYQQLQTYQITSEVARRDDLRAAGVISRAWMGYSFSRFALEAGLRGKSEDFTEEPGEPSHDNWEVALDLGLYMDLYALQLRPFVEVSYTWFRDQFDRDEMGVPLSDEDKLQLLKFYYGADFGLNLKVFSVLGRAYTMRQDDGAEGFERYWQYGVRAAADINLVLARLTVGGHLWWREYSDRVDLDPQTGERSTTTERYARLWVEFAYGVAGPLSVGLRYVFERRDSDIDNGGFAANEIALFVEVKF